MAYGSRRKRDKFRAERAAAAEAAPAPVAVAEPVEPDAVPEGTINEVLDWVGIDKDRAQQALDEEKGGSGKPRKTLVAALESLLA